MKKKLKKWKGKHKILNNILKLATTNPNATKLLEFTGKSDRIQFPTIEKLRIFYFLFLS